MNIDNSVNNNMFTHFKSLEGMKGIYEGFCKASMSFKFDRIVWKVIEDQYDGYRSQIDWIIYGDQDIEFAIDDSPKHALEYAKHGIECHVPVKSYNKQTIGINNIKRYQIF